jgi:hypothetical protein
LKERPGIIVPHNKTVSPYLFLIVVLFANATEAAWPNPPVRSGTTLPHDRRLAAKIDAAGIYVPEVEEANAEKTALVEGVVTWNLRLIHGLGLFGKHSISRMWWTNVSGDSSTDLSLLYLGSEFGLRFLCCKYLSFEAAYLGHRTERTWIEEDGDSMNFSPGGVKDHGGEVGIWGRYDPLAVLRLEGHLFGRAFRVYRDDQYVLGLGFRLSVLPASGHSLIFDLEVLGVYRADPRAGVDTSTWNIIGKIEWNGDLTPWLGMQLGLRVSSNWFCGEVPMLELKRSMIDVPMATGIIGFYFFI